MVISIISQKKFANDPRGNQKVWHGNTFVRLNFATEQNLLKNKAT